MSPLRVGLYVRVSTQEQAIEGYSIPAQTERLSAYCTAKEWTVFHTYTDAGYSGSNMERPALGQLIRDVSAKRLDLVLVYKLDRLSRSQKDTLYLIEDVFLAADVDFVSMNENFDTSTPLGRAMIGILSVFAQLEREQIKERTSMGRAERAKNGLWHGGGFRPYGYNYIDGTLHINDIEALHIRDVYQRFLLGQPITSIVDSINEKYGTSYGHSVIRSMLKTPLYAGIISWMGHEYEGRHTAIIDRATFDAAQALLQDREVLAAARPSPFRPTTLLTGLLYCGHCGQRYFSKGNYSGRGARRVYRPYYTCYSRGKSVKRLVVDPHCVNPSYPVQELDAFIVDEMTRLAVDDAYLDSLYYRDDADSDKEKDDETIIRRRIDEIDQQSRRLIDLYQMSSIDVSELDIRMGKLKKERTSLEKSLSPVQPARKRPAKSEIRQFVHDFLACDEQKEKRRILSSLIDKILLGATRGDIRIMWRF